MAETNTKGASMERAAFYFGFGSGGHFLRTKGGYRTYLEPREADPSLPWDIGLMDTGLLKNRKVPDDPDGRVHWVCAGRPLWFGFFWWDRSGDKRDASNSGFYVRGFSPETVTKESVEAMAPAAFAFACEQWPEIVSRQLFPLVLQPMVAFAQPEPA